MDEINPQARGEVLRLNRQTRAAFERLAAWYREWEQRLDEAEAAAMEATLETLEAYLKASAVESALGNSPVPTGNKLNWREARAKRNKKSL